MDVFFLNQILFLHIGNLYTNTYCRLYTNAPIYFGSKEHPTKASDLNYSYNAIKYYNIMPDLNNIEPWPSHNYEKSKYINKKYPEIKQLIDLMDTISEDNILDNIDEKYENDKDKEETIEDENKEINKINEEIVYKNKINQYKSTLNKLNSYKITDEEMMDEYKVEQIREAWKGISEKELREVAKEVNEDLNKSREIKQIFNDNVFFNFLKDYHSVKLLKIAWLKKNAEKFNKDAQTCLDNLKKENWLYENKKNLLLNNYYKYDYRLKNLTKYAIKINDRINKNKEINSNNEKIINCSNKGISKNNKIINNDNDKKVSEDKNNLLLYMYRIHFDIMKAIVSYMNY